MAKDQTAPAAAEKTTDVAAKRAENFVRLAPGRVDKAVQAVRQVANLFSANYTSTDEQRKQMMDYLNSEFNALNTAASGKGEAKASGFSFGAQ